MKRRGFNLCVLLCASAIVGCVRTVELIECHPHCDAMTSDASVPPPCDDGDPCTENDTLIDGVCQGRPLDADDDGAVAAHCGGDDCDDGDPLSSPALIEGPSGSASCSDGRDNDCDQRIDSVDPTCSSLACSKDGWCWQRPGLPTTHLSDVFALAADDVWAVGAKETVLHFDGSRWSAMIVEADGDFPRGFDAISARTPDELWIYSSMRLLRWDGSYFTQPAPLPRHFTMGAAQHLFALPDSLLVTDLLGLLQWQDASWSDLRTGATKDLWAASESDIWLIDSATNALAHWDGSAWSGVTRADGDDGEQLVALSGRSSSDLWVAGDEGSLLHYDGVALRRAARPTQDPLADIWAAKGAANAAVWAVARSGAIVGRGATSWTVAYEAEMALAAVHGSSAENVWAVGDAGALVRFDGASWRRVWRDDWPRECVDASCVAGTQAAWIQALWGSSSSDVWAVIGDTVEHFDGEDWTARAAPLGAPPSVRALWGTGTNDVWLLESDAVLHYDGSGWSREVVGNGNQAIWGANASDIWIVGSGAQSYHYSGGGWQSVPLPAGHFALNAVHGSASDDVWAVGQADGVIHWDGTRWSGERIAGASWLRGVWALSRDDVWVVGGSGAHHFDGTAWSSSQGPSYAQLEAVWARSRSEVWSVGEFGQINRWDGTSWQSQRSGTTMSLDKIWGVGSGVWVGGWRALLYRASAGAPGS